MERRNCCYIYLSTYFSFICLWYSKPFVLRKLYTTITAKWPSLTQQEKVNLSLYRFFGVEEVEVPRTYRQSTHEGGRVVSHMHRSFYLPRKIPGTCFVLEAESTAGPKCGWTH